MLCLIHTFRLLPFFIDNILASHFVANHRIRIRHRHNLVIYFNHGMDINDIIIQFVANFKPRNIQRFHTFESRYVDSVRSTSDNTEVLSQYMWTATELNRKLTFIKNTNVLIKTNVGIQYKCYLANGKFNKELKNRWEMHAFRWEFRMLELYSTWIHEK